MNGIIKSLQLCISDYGGIKPFRTGIVLAMVLSYNPNKASVTALNNAARPVCVQPIHIPSLLALRAGI